VEKENSSVPPQFSSEESEGGASGRDYPTGGLFFYLHLARLKTEKKRKIRPGENAKDI